MRLCRAPQEAVVGVVVAGDATAATPAGVAAIIAAAGTGRCCTRPLKPTGGGPGGCFGAQGGNCTNGTGLGPIAKAFLAEHFWQAL